MKSKGEARGNLGSHDAVFWSAAADSGGSDVVKQRHGPWVATSVHSDAGCGHGHSEDFEMAFWDAL